MVPSPATRRWIRFAGIIVLIAFLWLMILPSLETVPAVSQHIQNQQQQGIDPSAMFYSELEILPQIARRVELLNESHTMFWIEQPERNSVRDVQH